jgi:cellulose synthase/poly-beta-1,6-N-acetylglucosamine synthase-like glycosyltransferase
MNEYIKGLTVIINTIWNYKLFFDTNLLNIYNIYVYYFVYLLMILYPKHRINKLLSLHVANKLVRI